VVLREGSILVKVAYFHHSGDLYGSSKSLLYLLSELRKKGVTPLVVLAEDGPFHQVMKERGFAVELVENVPVLRRKMFRSLSDFLGFFRNFTRSLPRIRRILRENGIELIHSNDLVVGLMPGIMARVLTIPHVWHIRSNLSEFTLFTSLMRWLVHFLSSTIIGVSQSVVCQLGSVNISKIRLVYNGLPDEIIGRQLPFDTTFRARHGLAAADLVICCVGRINGWKGQDFLATAFASIQNDLPATVKLLFVGDPYPGSEFHQTQLEARIHQLGIGARTCRISFVTDVRSVYAAIDILVVPSVVPEPFGLVVVEGMAYGCPIIAANHGGPSEILQDRITGLFYEPDDLQGLADGIRQLVDDAVLRRMLGVNARSFMEHSFSITETADRVYDAYRSCLTR
jgi:glycosyltransferase involved in cell wall biosynthesis